MFLCLLLGLRLLRIHTLFTCNCTLPCMNFQKTKKSIINTDWLVKTENTYLFANLIGRLYYSPINSSFSPSDCQGLVFIVYFIQKINKQKPQLNKVRKPEGRALTTYHESRDQQGEDSSSFLTRTQPRKSHGLLVHLSPPDFLFPFLKVFSFPGHWHVAFHSCRPWIATLC